MIKRFAGACFLLSVTTMADAHPGGLDASGCHHERRTGGYHCHRGPSAQPPSDPAPRTPQPAVRPAPAQVEAPDVPAAFGAFVQPSTNNLSAPTIGFARIIDGDTLEIDGRRIRLFGIDAFERTQRCAAADGVSTACGELASEALTQMIGDSELICTARDTDRYQRVVAVCRAGSMDIAAELVRSGWAIAYTRYSRDYVRDEEVARNAQLGAWAGQFDLPEGWRRRAAEGSATQ